MTKLRKKKYDLEERTAKFAEEIIKLVKSVSQNPINMRIISQLVGSGGSIGANYCEANEAESKRDFMHKISICKKEIKETRHWLRLLLKSNPEIKSEIKTLQKENQELLFIFAKILSSCRKKQH
jgi:four helix bundle protein